MQLIFLGAIAYLLMRVKKHNLQVEKLRKTQVDLKTSKEWYQNIHESTSDSLFVADMRGKIVDVNPADCSTYGYTKKELVGKHVADIIHPDDHPVFEHFIEELRDNGSFSGDTIDICKDGTTIHTEMKGSLLNFNGHEHMVAIMHDITQRKKDLAEKESLIAELEQALNKVKKLSGLIPICAKCNKIRDDKGYWNRGEEYLEKNSEAKFSHGLCEVCEEELYGDKEWYKKVKQRRAKRPSHKKSSA